MSHCTSPCANARRGLRIRGLFKLLAGLAIVLASVAAEAQEGPQSDIDYRLGSGLRVPVLGLSLGGYATAGFERLHDRSARAAVDDFSLSVWWENAGRLKVFGEFNYENAISSRASEASDEGRYLALERFYLDYALGESTTLRAGKFLTPIGRWNLVHATPLVWTTSRPMVTTVAFPTNVTGVMLSGSVALPRTHLEYSIYGSSGDEVRPNPALDTFHEALGLRVVAPLSAGLQIGVSYVSFEQAHAEDIRKQLYGVDFFWTRYRFEVSAEAVYRVLHQPGVHDEGGGFVQVVAPLAGQLFAVARFESYRQASQASPTRLLVTGLSYRFNPAVVLKGEWISAKHNDLSTPEGFLASVSVLF